MRLRISKPDHSTRADLASALLDCHAKIRFFNGQASRLWMHAEDLPVAEAAEAASGIARYFAEALPLHEADEEESIRPLLAGRSAMVDTALSEMNRQHGALHDPVSRLISQCREISADPSRVADEAVTADLSETLKVLAPLWERHLELEEGVIFPALEAFLAPHEREAIHREIRLRRSHGPADELRTQGDRT